MSLQDIYTLLLLLLSPQYILKGLLPLLHLYPLFSHLFSLNYTLTPLLLKKDFSDLGV